MVEAAVIPAGLAVKTVYTLRFVDHGIGVDVDDRRPK
jgi:hypothetical protein